MTTTEASTGSSTSQGDNPVTVHYVPSHRVEREGALKALLTRWEAAFDLPLTIPVQIAVRDLRDALGLDQKVLEGEQWHSRGPELVDKN